VKIPTAPNAKRGPCRLCGRVGKRTKTHVPPEASGNDGLTRRAVINTSPSGTSTLELGRASLGGRWGYWFCPSCNGRTGVWDQEYLDWHGRIQRAMYPTGSPPGRPLPPGQFTNADPGAFVRCLWAWLFALDETETLHMSHAALGHAILTGEPIAPPSDLQLLLGVTLKRRARLFAPPPGGVEVRTVLPRASPLWVPPASAQPEITPLPLAVIQALPFVVIFATPGDRHKLAMFDAGQWLTEAAGQRRPVAIMLPTVDVHDDGVRPIAYSDIRVMTGQRYGAAV
jgi:hypothetical protein